MLIKTGDAEIVGMINNPEEISDEDLRRAALLAASKDSKPAKEFTDKKMEI